MRVWSILVGVSSGVLATLYGLYLWSEHLDRALVDDLLQTRASLQASGDWRDFRVPRQGALKICFWPPSGQLQTPCLCVVARRTSDLYRDVTVHAASEEAVLEALTEHETRARECARLLISTRRFTKVQWLEVDYEGTRIRNVHSIYPG